MISSKMSTTSCNAEYEYAAAPYELYGLSTDTKPAEVPNGTAFIEMDTSKMFFFDAESKTWLEWGA